MSSDSLALMRVTLTGEREAVSVRRGHFPAGTSLFPCLYGPASRLFVIFVIKKA